MKINGHRLILVLLAWVGWIIPSQAQSYLIDWYKIGSGGGVSTGGIYSVSGTIGQHDAGSTMTGGNYSVTGGFWSVVQVIQTPGAPTLQISQNATGVTIYWQNASGWTLQQNTNISIPAAWTNSSNVTVGGATNSLTLKNPAGSLFFRLKK